MKKISILFLSLLFIISCSDNNPTEPEDHFQPEGWVFINGASQRFMQIFQGKFSVGSDTLFTVPNGEDSDHISIKFLDGKKIEIEPPSDKDKTLSWDIKDTTMIGVHRHDGEEWEFHLEGKKVGETEIQFYVMHNGHSDVRSGYIKVMVQ
jgi:hypothetical protein